MKRFLAIVLVVVTLAGAGWFYHSHTTSPTTVARQFLQHLSRNEISSALELGTPTLRINTSRETLELRVKQLGLESLQNVSWTDVQRKGNGVAVAFATANLGNNGQVPLKIQLLEQDNQWRVDYLMKTRGDLAIPTDTELQKMVGNTLVDLSRAILNDKFEEFRGQCSRSLQVLNSPNELRHSFLKIDYTFAKEMSPHFVKDPILDEEGHLHLIGNYSTRPSRLDFMATYAHESGQWRLLSVHIHLIDAYEQQAARFMHLLGNKDYTQAYNLTSAAFRQATEANRFSDVVATWKLREHDYVVWNEAETSGEVVKLTGEMPMENGSMRPIEVGMRLEQNNWMVDYIR